ncbi:hypothetical protein [Engelhardtia mirabilis]|uniref:hypothetical protein n=1 Tax=Engelhardtia mirabilis TaxID=2528011 RepID=UPI00119D6666
MVVEAGDDSATERVPLELFLLEVRVVDSRGFDLPGAVVEARASHQTSTSVWRLDAEAAAAFSARTTADVSSDARGWTRLASNWRPAESTPSTSYRSSRSSLRVEAGGVHRLALCATGSLEVTLRAEAPGYLFRSAEPMVMGPFTEQVLVLDRAPVVRGRIVDEWGTALEVGALHVACQPGLPDDPRARTDTLRLAVDASGRFEASLPVASRVDLRLSSPGHGYSATTSITASPQGEYDLGDVQVGGSAAIRLRLELADGTPLAGRLVRLESLDSPPRLAPVHRTTDSAGRIEFRGLAAGSYAIAPTSLTGPIEPIRRAAVVGAREETAIVDALLVQFELAEQPDGRTGSSPLSLVVTPFGTGAGGPYPRTIRLGETLLLPGGVEMHVAAQGVTGIGYEGIVNAGLPSGRRTILLSRVARGPLDSE